jgi:hypothetical protein
MPEALLRYRSREPRGRLTDMLTSRYVDGRELRMYAVIGRERPPLLLVHG